MLIGYNIPKIEGGNKKLHYMPYSGGLFIIFGGTTLIGLSTTISTYISIYLNSMFNIIGIIILIYGIMTAFFYPETPEM